MLNLLEWALLPVGGCIAGLLYLGGVTAWERMKPEPPADYVLTVSDPDGIPIRQHKMSAKGAGRIITDLNAAPNYYK